MTTNLLNNNDFNIKDNKVSYRKTQAERRKDSEEKILEAALELVAEYGAYAVTLAQIGEKAGYSRGLPAHKYGNKSNLLKELAKYIAAKFSIFTIKATIPQPGIQCLESMIQAYLLRKDKNWKPAWALIMLTTEAKLLGNDLSEYMAQYNDKVLSFLRKNIETAILENHLKSDCNATEIAAFFLSIFRGATLLRMNNPKIDLNGIYQQAFFYLDQLRASPSKRK